MLCTTCNPDRQLKDSQAGTDMGMAGSDALGTSKSGKSPKNFLDSVYAKKAFTFREINEHADIDSIYYKKRVRFVGDTVWYRHGRHPLAVIRLGKGTINKKLLLVFNRHGDCTASLVVAMDGDVDSYDSVILNYKMLGVNSFSTTEVWTYRGGSKEDKITVTKQFYVVNKKGSIMAQDNIIRSFTKPKAIAVMHRQ
jgi:hypothetical protein